MYLLLINIGMYCTIYKMCMWGQITWKEIGTVSPLFKKDIKCTHKKKNNIKGGAANILLVQSAMKPTELKVALVLHMISTNFQNSKSFRHIVLIWIKDTIPSSAYGDI